MFDLLFYGGTTNVIFSLIIMLKRLQKIQPIRGLTFAGRHGGILLFEILLWLVLYLYIIFLFDIYSMTWFIPCT